jgi:4-hydroxy-tetrahydrodipicolinate synthase
MAKPKVKWEGSLPALVTPFTQEGAIDEEAYRFNVRSYILDDQVNGIVIGGHNGEPWALSADEKVQLFALARKEADKIKPGFTVIAGVDAVSTRELVVEAKRAEEVGVDGLMITPPFYVATSTEAELWQRFEGVAKATKLPIMLYNNPRRTGINLEPPMISKLADIDSIVAVKQAVRDFVQFSETIRLAGDRVGVMPGPSGFIFPGILLGIKGYVATGPDLLGRAGARMYYTVRAGDLETGRQLHHKLVQTYAMLNKIGTWPAAYKAALDMLGKRGGFTRDPVHNLTAAQRAQVADVLKSLGLV